MYGTFPYCRTHEAIKWLNDGDTIQHIENETYFKKENDTILISDDNHHWREFKSPMEIFPPFAEWRSVSNLHYYNDLHDNLIRTDLIRYLSFDDEVVHSNNSKADKTKKRWFVGGVL